MKWRLADIVAATGGRLLYGPEDREFNAIGIDSRSIAPDAIFVAICGATHDAHAFVPQVVAKGVRGIVVGQRSKVDLDHAACQAQGVACVLVRDTTRALGALAGFQRRQVHIPVLAITGSTGKTTTRLMTAMVMARRFKTLATEGNLNNEIGLPLTLFGLTPEHQAAVLELGMNHPGEMDRLGAICSPTMGMITNAGPAHLEFLGSVEAVARAKGELLRHIDPKGHVILNKDDAHVAALADQAPCPVFFFGTDPRCEVHAGSIREGAGKVTFELVLPHDRVAVELQTPGRFMVLNALAAAAAGYLAGVPVQAIKAGLESFRSIKGRLNVVTTANGIHILDDTYNANPASMAAAMETLVTAKGSRRGFIVLGEMLELGAQAPTLHREVGRLAGKAGPEKLYAFGEHARDMLAGAGEAGMASHQLAAATKEEIAAQLIETLRPGDWVLVKGSRGTAMETVVGAIERWAETVSGGPEQRSRQT
jgi:UDP-N-acetylmuramoyl-tripeptide--D-alanyl-D-alanine ligase